MLRLPELFQDTLTSRSLQPAWHHLVLIKPLLSQCNQHYYPPQQTGSPPPTPQGGQVARPAFSKNPARSVLPEAPGPLRPPPTPGPPRSSAAASPHLPSCIRRGCFLPLADFHSQIRLWEDVTFQRCFFLKTSPIQITNSRACQGLPSSETQERTLMAALWLVALPD